MDFSIQIAADGPSYSIARHPRRCLGLSPVRRPFETLIVGIALLLAPAFSGAARSATVDRALVGKWHSTIQDRDQRPGRERLLQWDIRANGSSSMMVILSESGFFSSNSERWGIVPPSGGVELAHGLYSLRSASSFSTSDAGMPYGTITWNKLTASGGALGIDACIVDTVREPTANSRTPGFNAALVGTWQGSAAKPNGERVAMLWQIGASGRTFRFTQLNSFSVSVDAADGRISTALPNEAPARESYRIVNRDQFEVASSGQRSTWARCN